MIHVQSSYIICGLTSTSLNTIPIYTQLVLQVAMNIDPHTQSTLMRSKTTLALAPLRPEAKRRCATFPSFGLMH
uniref:Uncharacterized protein n=1 Tax=Manihot esculenta TaxID=3983 RepID=A0A2C9VU03_MANES